MGYELRITFVGLCLFRQKGSRPMDVLMPLAEHGSDHGHAHVHSHFARAFYRLEYERGTSPSGPGIVNGKNGTPYRQIELKHKWLKFELTASPALNDPLDPRLFVSVHNDIVKKEIPGELTAVKDLAACIALPPGDADVVDPRGPWTLVWPNGKAPPLGANTEWDKLGWKVVWKVRVPGETEVLDWGLKDFEGKSPTKLNRLTAKDELIEMLISNVPKAQSVPDAPDAGSAPRPGTEAGHFQAFKVLYDESDWPRLVYRRKDSSDVTPASPDITAYSCVPGKGQ
jgi:hypothetical protein